MFFYPRRSLIGLLALKALAHLANAEDGVNEEPFTDLKRWEAINFPGSAHSSSYSIVETEEGESLLLAESNGGASGIVWQVPLDLNKQPVIEWKWRVVNAPQGINHREKAGDDYPLRIQVVFAYDSERLSFSEKLLYEAYRLRHGRYPPHASLNYVWTPNEKKGARYPCPYTKRVRIKVLRGEETPLGETHEQTVNIVEDYQAIFGEAPPATARIAIMADSDDSQTRSRAFVDFIHLREEDD